LYPAKQKQQQEFIKFKKTYQLS